MMDDLPKTQHALDSIATRKIVVVGIVRDAVDELLTRIAELDAPLAERDTMRCTSCDDEAECSILTAVCEHSDWEIEDGYQFGCCLHTDIRARADEAKP